jgi:hypothetical protein
MILNQFNLKKRHKKSAHIGHFFIRKYKFLELVTNT